MADIPIFPDPQGVAPSKFVHLHVHSDYSILDGAAKLSQLIGKAKALNMSALALTDHGNMFGVLNFYHICKANKIKPIVGCEFYVSETDHTLQERTKYGGKYYHLILLCENDTGYKNMCKLSSRAFTEGLHYGRPNIDFKLLEQYHEGMICLSACIQGQVPQAFLNGDDANAEEVAKKYLALFGKDRYYLEIQDHGMIEQKDANKKIIALAHKLGIGLVATNDIHYCEKEDAESQEILCCIGYKKTLKEPHQTMGGGRTEWYFKSENEMRILFPGLDEAYDNTLKIADMCHLEIKEYTTPELRHCLPRFDLPDEYNKDADYTKNQDAYVKHLVEEGVKARYNVECVLEVPEYDAAAGGLKAADKDRPLKDTVIERACYELSIIFKMGFSGYFLIVWEFIHWAKSHGIPIGPGRGSGAGSIVAYCMEITDIDPLRFNLLFERFLNPERVSMPDFDIDMDYDFRQDIIQHTRDLYGADHVGHIVTFGTLQPKMCIADVGRVLDIPLNEVNMLKSCIPDAPKTRLIDAFNPPTQKCPDGGKLAQYKDDERYKKLFELAFKLEGTIRNTGLHASGMVIGLTPLPDWVPVFKDSKTDSVAVQYTMDIIEPCGLVKFDYLGLKTLSLIRYAQDIINRHKNVGENDFDVSKVADNDSATYDMFDKGDSVAVFQFESPGMQKILQQVKPRRLEELVALNALYRPGPMDYIPQYIEGKWKPATVHYPDPCLEGILKETYGVMVYQEQVMQVSQKIAGFSLGAADMLRRAMGKKKKEVLMGKKKEFIDGALKNGFTEKHADDIFEIMVPFAGYGFNKSHAAAYTVLAYRTAYLKCHKTAEFMAANFTNELGTKDGIPRYMIEAKHMGLIVDAPHINKSDVLFDATTGRIEFALLGIKGMGEAVAKMIVEERKAHGLYKNFIDFLERMARIQYSGAVEDKRVPVTSKSIEVLIKAGCFDGLGENRMTLLSNMDSAMKYAAGKYKNDDGGEGDLFGGTGEKTYADFVYKEVEDAPHMEYLNMEKEVIGTYVSGHPLDDYKEKIARCVTLTGNYIDDACKERAIEVKQLERVGKKTYSAGAVYTVLGIVSDLHEATTAKGQMAFAKLTDYENTFGLTFFAKTWEKARDKVSDGAIMAFRGRADDSHGESTILVDSVEDIDTLKEKTITALHIDLGDFEEDALSDMQKIILSNKGKCFVYFHFSEGDESRGLMKAGSRYCVSYGDKVADALGNLPYVNRVWWQ